MNIPNLITLIRIFLTPCFVVFFYVAIKTEDFRFYIPCFLISLLQELTDLIDGIFARRRREITDLGKIIDPYADLMSHFTAFLCLLYGGFIPLWAVAIIFWREAFVYTLRILLAKKSFMLHAQWSGKVKAVTHGGAIYFVLFFIILQGYFPSFPLSLINTICMSIAVVCSIWSWIDYIKISIRILKEKG